VPLDPAAKALMDAMEATFPDVLTMTPPEARAHLKQMFGSLATEPEPVARVENRFIPGPGGPLPVRIYWPHERTEAPLPALVYFHGGGFVVCDLDSHDPTCRAITNSVECVVVSVDYRLAPEHRFPAATEDAYEATLWVTAHAATLGVDANRIAVGGDSAGGNLAAAVALMARDRGVPRLVFQLMVYPVTDLTAMDNSSYRENGDGYFLTTEKMDWYRRQYLADIADAAHPYASPLRADDVSGLPPALVITAEFDPLRDEGEDYASRLAEAGVPAAATRYDGVFHGFFSLRMMLDAAKQANEEAYAALRAAFARPSPFFER
jgi:acetyl esterase